jgi:hypothetical protein
MKRIMFLALVLFCTYSSYSQRAKKPNPYSFGAGVGYNPALNSPVSINIKFYTQKGYSFEFIGYNLQTGYRLTALFLPYFPIDRKGNLRGLIGPGIHIGMWKNEYKTNSYTTNPIIGGDGIVGFEYRIPKIPLSLQAHFQPSADLAGNNEYFYGKEMLGVVARFVF